MRYGFNQEVIIERFKNGKISIGEAFQLLTNKQNIKDDYQWIIEDDNPLKENKKDDDTPNLEEVLAEMDELIGLDNIKSIIRDYIAFLNIQGLRKRHNLKTQNIVMHMIFKGNPGTGKTTMARIIGKIFKNIGYLKKGDLIEVDRSELVGEYIGHTAQKTKKIINKALGGILFIDEAYSLARGGEKDFGKEAIDTMVKAMEDHKEELIIILAGYPREMDSFLESNPGLRSRFALQISFLDYSIDELIEIAELMFKEREYILDKESKHYIYRVLTTVRNSENKNNNGNARTVRNLVESAIRHQARRISNLEKIQRDDLIVIKKEDLSGEEYTYG